MKSNYELYKNDPFKGYNILDEVVVTGRKKQKNITGGNR